MEVGLFTGQKKNNQYDGVKDQLLHPRDDVAFAMTEAMVARRDATWWDGPVREICKFGNAFVFFGGVEQIEQLKTSLMIPIERMEIIA